MKRLLGFAGLSLAVGLAVAYVANGWLAVLWLLSLFPFLRAARQASSPRPKISPSRSRLALLLFAAALPVVVRVAQMDSRRLHNDEFITAYLSATHDFRHTSLFGLLPQEKSEWVAHFPKPYFLLQRGFLALFGSHTDSIRLSVQIYVAIVSVMLFLIAEEILDRSCAVVAVILYSFFAPSVYFETLGLHFVSATAIFTVFFYFALRQNRTESTLDAAISGVACGFCYLTYYSSYLAFPLLIVMAVVGSRRSKRALALRNFSVACCGFLIVVAPFLAHNIRSGFLLARRPAQVALLTGSWSPYRAAVSQGASPIPIIEKNFVRCLEAFVRDGVGGQGGYDFGHLALLNRVSLALVLAGGLAGLFLLSRKKELLFVFLVIGAVFLMGLVLTIPPPAYHRFSIAFPFLVLLMALPFGLVSRAVKWPAPIRLALAAGFLLLFVCANERQFVEATTRDAPERETDLLSLLQQRFGDRKVSIAGRPSHRVQAFLYFQDVPRDWTAPPVPPETLLAHLDRNQRYACILTFADRLRRDFESADPNGRFYRISSYYGVFAN